MWEGSRERRKQFFCLCRLVFGYVNIFAYYEMLHVMKLGGYSMSELDNLMPYEVEIFAAMYKNYLDTLEKNKGKGKAPK
jgi:hypothetical protein